MQCIYVDVLIILNWYINYFIFLATAKITHTAFTHKRLILASLLGAISSLLILLPPMHYVVNVLVKFMLSIGLILVAFGRSRITNILKMSLYFCVIGFIFAGMIMAIKSTFDSRIISTNNSYIYVDFSISFLVVSTTVCYATICVIRRLLDRNSSAIGDWSLMISYDNRCVTIEGLADTGNSLVDTFSGRPVIVCSEAVLKGIVTVPTFDNLHMENLRGFRLIPFSTIGDGGVIALFRPDSVVIVDNLKGQSKTVDALIGISGDSNKAIFNPKIFV